MKMEEYISYFGRRVVVEIHEESNRIIISYYFLSFFHSINRMTNAEKAMDRNIKSFFV